MNNNSKISVVIPAYGNWDLVKENIDSLITYDSGNIDEVVIVDDHSNQSNPYQFPDYVKVIVAPVNKGYATTASIGLKEVNGDYIILLDSDASLIAPIVSKVISHFEKDQKLGCIGFKSVNAQGRPTGSYRFFPTVTGYVLGQKIDSILQSQKKYPDDPILPYSCCVAFRKKCIDEVGSFDAELFPVLEADNDLSIRIHKAGWNIKLAEDVTVKHEGGNSYKIDSKRVIMFHESQWNLLRKHKLIKNVWITKLFLKLRIIVEIIILSLFKNQKEVVNKDKLNGRKKIFLEINNYQ